MAGWLDAPLIRTAVSSGNGISSGSIRFRTGGSREEAEQIVRGLNNTVSRINKME
jgi:hypothetical protein